MAEFLRNYWAYLIGALLLHVLFAGIFGLTLISMARKPQPAALAIQAVVVDRSVLDRAARQQRDRAKEREDQRQQQQAEQRKQQERREAEQKVEQERQQEQKQREVEQQRRLVEEQQQREQQETQRKAQAEAERKAQVETERQRKAEAERQRVAEIERKQKEEAERRKAAEDARDKEQRESDLRKQLEEEEGRSEAESAGLLNQYIALIEQRIVRNWNRPPSARPGLECSVHVSQTSSGTVLSVQIDQSACNGDVAVKQSIEAAVMKSSPLPPPPDPRLFERNLVLVFKPEE
jgi:colicin import membrane protein